MANYYYNKYNAVGTSGYSTPTGFSYYSTPSPANPGSSWGTTGYTFNSTNGFITNGIPSGSVYVGQITYSVSEATIVYKDIIDSFNGSVYAFTRYISTCSAETVYSQGTLVTDNIIAADGTYPVNGYYASDGYWYVRQGLVPPPTAPTSAHTDSKTTTQIVMGWTDNSTNETGFKMYKNDTLITTIAAGSVSYTFTGLTAGTQYDLAVKATNTDGGDSAEAQLTETTVIPVPNLKPRVDGALKTYADGWVRIDGALRHITDMWTKIDGALKKL